MPPLRSLVAAVAITAVAACSSGPALPGTDPQIDGVLIERLGGVPSLDAPVRVLVAENRPRPWQQTIVSVGLKIPVYVVGRGGQLVPADPSVLNVGDRLRVWTMSAEARSNPAELNATRVYIMR